VCKPPRSTTASPDPPKRPAVSSTAPSNVSRAESKPLRFYLELSSPVVDAPSIGPRTAERLAAIGITTIHDLLRAEPQDAAKRLAYRRVNADTIFLWQQQARMVCQIPQLRGHDAQLLIACGFTDPEALSRMDPKDVFAVVGPFAGTTQGRRLLRSAKKPNLEEVTNWVTWAGQTRRLDAA
jgi:hypothetical protein